MMMLIRQRELVRRAKPLVAEADAGENPKGGTGYGVRLLTQWIMNLK
jgi:leucyl aminopeptidase